MTASTTIEWTEVLVAVISGFVVLATPVVGFIVTRRKRHPEPDVQTEAIAQVEATVGVDRDSLAFAQQALHTANRALEQQNEDSRRLKAVEEELADLRWSYRVLFKWAHDLIDQWHSLRGQPDPPPLPQNIHRPQ